MAAVGTEAVVVQALPPMERLLTVPGRRFRLWSGQTPDGGFEARAVHTYPIFPGSPKSWADVLKALSPTNATGARTNPDGELVAYMEGGLDDVIDFVLMIPPPEDRMAPKLVLPKVVGVGWSSTPGALALASQGGVAL
ncbi:hypothetical protein JNUCC0626_20200 [Lentzea sp. JNUCC 0626]|uniref:hypothetical protein n=1 Tax=Lentzea sp. JNUCC 0626 TaxID=3367513 RepID=UPI003749E9B6